MLCCFVTDTSDVLCFRSPCEWECPTIHRQALILRKGLMGDGSVHCIKDYSTVHEKVNRCSIKQMTKLHYCII